MGYLRVNITNIVSPNPFKVSFKSVVGDDSAYGGFTVTTGYTYYYNGNTYSDYNSCPSYYGGTTSVEISSDDLEFNTNCWVKLEDTVTKTRLSNGTEIPRYIIENVYLHDPIAYQSCCPQPEDLTAVCYHDCYPPFSLTAVCVNDVTPPPPTLTPTPTPTATPTPTPTLTPTPTPTPTPTEVPLTRFAMVGPYSTEYDACVAGNLTGPVLGFTTVTNDNIAVGSLVYNNPLFGETTLMTGVPGWYAIGGSLIGIYSGIRIDTTGTIVELGTYSFCVLT